jgi:hypothetical protein
MEPADADNPFLLPFLPSEISRDLIIREVFSKPYPQPSKSEAKWAYRAVVYHHVKRWIEGKRGESPQDLAAGYACCSEKSIQRAVQRFREFEYSDAFLSYTDIMHDDVDPPDKQFVHDLLLSFLRFEEQRRRFAALPYLMVPHE